MCFCPVWGIKTLSLTPSLSQSITSNEVESKLNIFFLCTVFLLVLRCRCKTRLVKFPLVKKISTFLNIPPHGLFSFSPSSLLFTNRIIFQFKASITERPQYRPPSSLKGEKSFIPKLLQEAYYFLHFFPHLSVSRLSQNWRLPLALPILSSRLFDYRHSFA